MPEVVTVINPATEEVIAEVPLAGMDEVDAAVARSEAAGPGWRSVAPADRARLLRRFAAQVEEHGEELARLETANVGKPLADSRGEVAMVAEVLYFYAGAVDKHRGATVPVAGGVAMTFHEPLGVVAAIIPWNFPMAIMSWKVGPALATGNTIVVKPAETTPLTALRLAELALDAGLPEGVLQVVVGEGPVAGNRLVTHPRGGQGCLHRFDVGRPPGHGRCLRHHQAGHPRARRQVGVGGLRRRRYRGGGGGHPCRGVRQCRPGLLRPEPGPGAADGVRSLSLPAGAGRSAPGGWATRPIRPPIWDPWSRPSTAGGSKASWLRVWAIPTGARSPCTRPGRCPTGPGYWFPPTVVAPAGTGWPMAREEIFGPVLAVIPFDDEEDAVRLANDTPFGLSGSIWTRDTGRALRMARAVQSGNLSVNSNSSVRVQTGFGGMKQSGFGRELGLEALDAYTDVKNVFIADDR